MYIPKHFDEPRVDVLHALMRARPLSTLVTLTAHGLEANHIPLLIDPQPAPFGTLRGHVARGNAMWKEFNPGIDVMAVFSGPDAYITPSWYPGKKVDGKVVPRGTTPWPTRRARSTSMTIPCGFAPTSSNWSPGTRRRFRRRGR